MITRITFIGGIFTAISLLSIPTFIIPMLTMIPYAMPIEIIFGKVFGHDDYSKTGNSVIISLIILFIVITYFFYNQFSRSIKETGKVSVFLFTMFLTIQLLIIHPLVFYIDTSRDWRRATDGQFIFRISETFPISSVIFIILGLFTDLYTNRRLAKLRNNKIGMNEM